jgi:hypothetical protein
MVKVKGVNATELSQGYNIEHQYLPADSRIIPVEWRCRDITIFKGMVERERERGSVIAQGGLHPLALTKI